jgi:hypothetical protein
LPTIEIENVEQLFDGVVGSFGGRFKNPGIEDLGDVIDLAWKKW